MSQTFDLNKLVTIDEAKALLSILDKIEFPTNDFSELSKAKELLTLMKAAKEGMSLLGDNTGMLLADEAKEMQERLKNGEKPEDVFADYSFTKRIEQMQDYVFAGDLLNIKRKLEVAVEVTDVEEELKPELAEIIDTLRSNSRRFMDEMNEEGEGDEE